MREHTKLKWQRVDGTFDLKVTNTEEINIDYLKSLLENVEMDRPDCRTPFSKKASRYLQQWLYGADHPLRAEAYCLLSNWFLTDSPGYKSSVRALYAGHLWDALFCARPKERLTSSERGQNHKILPAEFQRWWSEQQRCQDDCQIG